VATTAGSSACRCLPDDVTFLVPVVSQRGSAQQCLLGGLSGGQLRAAEFLLDHEDSLNWLPGWAVDPSTQPPGAAQPT